MVEVARGELGELDGVVVSAQVWRPPTSRRLPSDNTWLELSRWCLTPAAGKNAGSRQHAAAVKLLAGHGVTTLVADAEIGTSATLERAVVLADFAADLRACAALARANRLS